MAVHLPMLMDGMTADMLDCPDFRDAVKQCLLSHRPVVVVADESAVSALRTLTPADKQLWFTVPDDEAKHAELLSTLVAEASLRF
jgi:hypothetical protein